LSAFLLEFPVQRGGADPQPLRRFGPVAFRRTQGRGNVIAFDVGERANLLCGLNDCRWRPDFRRQVVCVDAIALRQDDSPLERVLQLANIAGPAVSEQQVRRLRRERWRLLAKTLGGAREKLPRQRQNVLAPIAQWRYHDLDDPETIVEI